MKNILIAIAIIFSIGLVYIALGRGENTKAPSGNTQGKIEENIYKEDTSSNVNTDDKQSANVYMEGKNQIIEINVKGGYSPMQSRAKSGLPTIIRFKTNNTFDCSSSISIPKLNVSEYLQNTGTKDINAGLSEKGKLSGTCGMGMYRFEIIFE